MRRQTTARFQTRKGGHFAAYLSAAARALALPSFSPANEATLVHPDPRRADADERRRAACRS